MFEFSLNVSLGAFLAPNKPTINNNLFCLLVLDMLLLGMEASAFAKQALIMVETQVLNSAMSGTFDYKQLGNKVESE